MTERIVLSTISIIMLALTFKKGNKRTILFTVGLTAGILITWIRIPVILTIGLYTYMLTALMITITSLRIKELFKLQQVTILLSGILAFGENLFSIENWPYADVVRLSTIIPLILYLISLLYGMTKRKEFGYLTILNVEFVLRLFR